MAFLIFAQTVPAHISHHDMSGKATGKDGFLSLVFIKQCRQDQSTDSDFHVKTDYWLFSTVMGNPETLIIIV